MFDIGQKVVVITGNAIPFNGVILARAKGDNGPCAYKVVPKDSTLRNPANGIGPAKSSSGKDRAGRTGFLGRLSEIIGGCPRFFAFPPSTAGANAARLRRLNPSTAAA